MLNYLFLVFLSCQYGYCEVILNDKNHYQTGALIPKQNHELPYIYRNQASFTSIYSYNFELPFAATPSIIYFITGQNAEGACISYEDSLTNSKYSLKITFSVSGLSACAISYFAISDKVQHIKMIKDWEIRTQNSPLNIFTKQVDFSNWNFLNYKGFAFIQGYHARNNSVFTSVLHFNSTCVTLSIYSAYIDLITISVVFFQHINDYFETNYLITQGGAKIIPDIRRNQLALGFMGLKSIRSYNRQLLFCYIDTSNLPFCEDQGPTSRNVYELTLIYVRSIVCIPGVEDTKMNRATCQCYPGLEYGATNDPYIVCVPILKIVDITQNFNRISITLAYILNVKFVGDVKNSVQITIDGQPGTPDIIEFKNGTIKINMTITTHANSIMVFITNSNYELLNHNATINEFLYHFSDTELKILNISMDFLSNTTQILQKIQSVGVVVGCIGFLLDFIQFVQQISLYIFVKIKFPFNVKTLLEIIYYSQSLLVLPIRLDPLFSYYDNNFTRPQIYEQYDFNFNFLSENFYFIVKFLILVVVYYVGDRISACLPKSGFLMILGKPIRAAYFLKFFRNCLEFVLSCEVIVVFGMLVTLMDRRLNNYYKIINFLLAIALLFLIEIIVIVINPILKINAKQKKYKRTIRPPNYYRNQVHLFIKYISFLIFALTVPYTSGLFCLSITLAFFIIKTITAYRIYYQNRFSKICSLLQNIMSILINVSLIVAQLFWQNGVNLFWFYIAGYVAVGAIVFKMICYELKILIEFIFFLKNILKKFCSKEKPNEILYQQQKKQNAQTTKTKKILPVVSKVILLSPDQVSQQKIIETRKQKRLNNSKNPRVRSNFQMRIDVKQFLSKLRKQQEQRKY